MPHSPQIALLPLPNKPDKITVRLSLLAFAIGSFAIGTAEFVIMGLLPEVAVAMQVSIPVAGHFIAFYALGVVIGAPILAVLTVGISRKKLLIILMICYAFGNLASAAVSNYYLFSIFRFLSALPHGTYFGVASVAAASMVEPQLRPKAIGFVILGLTVATLVGAPSGTWLGQILGWRTAFIMVALIALLAAWMIWYYVPSLPTAVGGSFLTELGVLKNIQMWLMLAIIGIGSSGFFAIFSYIKPILLTISHVPMVFVPFILLLFGCGTVVGNLLGSQVAIRLGLMRAIFFTTLWTLFIFAIFHVLIVFPLGAAVAVFLVGTCFVTQPAIHTRMIDLAGHTPTLAAALIHSAFNISNTIGAYSGGLVIEAGFGLIATATVGLIFSFIGLAIFLVSWMLEKKSG